MTAPDALSGHLDPADRIAIADLVARYAERVDARDLAAVAAMFTDDGVLVNPEPGALEPTVENVGRAGVVAAMGALREIPRTVHQIVGVVVDPDGPDAARGRIACVAHHATERDGTWADLVWHVRYVDRYRRTGTGWSIERRELWIDLIGTAPLRRVRTTSDGDGSGPSSV